MTAVTETLQPVLTRAALVLQNKNKNIEFRATVFHDLESFPKPTAPPPGHKSKDEKMGKLEGAKSERCTEFDLKKARHEVLNLAMNNQRIIKNKRKMQIFQAIKLGAKPPKKANKNYKEFLNERKRLKTIREERTKFHQLGKNQTGIASVKCKSKTKIEKKQKKRAPVTSIVQHYGVANPKLKKK